uniref:Uncharacterized protein n=1 Tax=Ralstonia solanacearum TaxID=305 RepID=A0A0S4W8Q7_RALSL|nr:conserved protein of unknown function [Ralstonia solanacearum]
MHKDRPATPWFCSPLIEASVQLLNEKFDEEEIAANHMRTYTQVLRPRACAARFADSLSPNCGTLLRSRRSSNSNSPGLGPGLPLKLYQRTTVSVVART